MDDLAVEGEGLGSELAVVTSSHSGTIRLVNGGQLLAEREWVTIPPETLAAVQQLVDRHNWAVGLERAAKHPGVLPLPPDHVPAAEHFMAAVHILFPGYAPAGGTSSA